MVKGSKAAAAGRFGAVLKARAALSPVHHAPWKCNLLGFHPTRQAAAAVQLVRPWPQPALDHNPLPAKQSYLGVSHYDQNSFQQTTIANFVSRYHGFYQGWAFHQAWRRALAFGRIEQPSNLAKRNIPFRQQQEPTIIDYYFETATNETAFLPACLPPFLVLS